MKAEAAFLLSFVLYFLVIVGLWAGVGYGAAHWIVAALGLG